MLSAGLSPGQETGQETSQSGGRAGTPITVMAVNVAETQRPFGTIISYAEGQEDFTEMRFDFIFERSLEPRNCTEKDRWLQSYTCDNYSFVCLYRITQ